MKNIFLIAAAIAGLATTAITVSCNKTETTENTPHENSTKREVIRLTPHEWWLNEGYSCCVEWLDHPIEFCYYSFESEYDPDNTWLMDIEEAYGISEMVYEDYVQQNISPARRGIYQSFLNRGFIEIKHDCPIMAPELLKLIDTDYIPAGNYPIFMRGDDLVIRFKK